MRLSPLRYVLFLVSCTMCILVSAKLQMQLVNAHSDIRPLYYGARTLIQGSDPYLPQQVFQAFQAEKTDSVPGFLSLRDQETRVVYPPCALLLAVPLALLPWSLAHVAWVILITVSLVFAAYAMLIRGSQIAPSLSLFLVCVLIANCEAGLIAGNPAAVSVGFCVIAVWFLLEDRLAWAGVLLFAVSLCIKPHNAGWIWLYFFAAGGYLRKRALQTLSIAAGLSLPSLLWVHAVAPNWLQEWRANLSSLAVRGGLNDPGPSAWINGSLFPIIDLRGIFAMFRDDPSFYSVASYLVCGVLLAIFIWTTLKSRCAARHAWLALAAVVPLTILATYHRPYDAKLLLLTIPACGLLWRRRGVLGWTALCITSSAIFLTADLLLLLFNVGVRREAPTGAGWLETLLTVPLSRPIPLVLLAMSVFYLSVYLKEVRSESISVQEKLEDPLFAAIGE